jgi:hypothetical protein
MKGFLLSLMLLFLFVGPVEVLGQEPADAPVLKDGDVWRYRVIEHGEYMITKMS